MNQLPKQKIRFPDGRERVKPRILVAPLDWGLGHATRCIPVIRELLALQCEVWLAGEGAQEQLLKIEFPDLPFLFLPGYRIQYAKTARGLLWKMIQQWPKMRRAIKFENRWLQKMTADYGFDAVISDNRYGMHHPVIPAVFITHQLLIKSFTGGWSERIIQKRNYRYINQFTECWVPDNETASILGGELSHPVVLPSIPVHYTGPLSRFEQKNTAFEKNHLLIILSGPEPQRSILEEKIIRDISHYNHTATVVRGLPGAASQIPSTNMIQFYNHLPATALNDEMCKAEYIISRSGYSTVMDLVALQKKSILIPTPGQTEQEYLGNYLMNKGIAFCTPQPGFSLTDALNAAASFTYTIPEKNSHALLAERVRLLITNLKNPV
jgi:Glycosyltransferase family 28 C-terminal domain